MSESPIVNPDVYLNYLPPEVAAGYEVFRNVDIATLGAYIWDMFSTASQEFKMMRTSRVTVSIVAYWVARLSTLVVLILSVLGKTGPINHCQGQILGVETTYLIAVAASSFLFLRRVQAVFFQVRGVHLCFGALWLVNVVIACLMPMHTTSIEIADTKHCEVVGEPPYIIAGCIVPLVYDSLVFLAVSYKVTMSYNLDQTPFSWKTFFSRPRAPHISRAIVQGGQQYYLVSVCANVVNTLLLLLPGVPSAYRTIPMLPSLALTSSMACRVFRHLFLEGIEREGGGHRNSDALTTVEPQIDSEFGGQATLSRGSDHGVPSTIV